MSNSLDPDQARRIVGPDLGPNCLPRLSADGTGGQRVKPRIKLFKEIDKCCFIIKCLIILMNANRKMKMRLM